MVCCLVCCSAPGFFFSQVATWRISHIWASMHHSPSQDFHLPRNVKHHGRRDSSMSPNGSRPNSPRSSISSVSSLSFSLPRLNGNPDSPHSHPSKLAASLTSAQVKALKYAFTWADANFNDTLDQNEVTELLSSLGYPCSNQVVDQLFKDMDRDGNGVVDFSELTDALGAAGAEKSKARQDSPGRFSTSSSPEAGMFASAASSRDKRLEQFFKKGRFTENVDALFATGITLNMLIEYSYTNARLNTLLEIPQTLTSEGKRRIRRMLCEVRNAQVLDSKRIAVIVHTRWSDDALLWTHQLGDAVVSGTRDALLVAGYAVHCIGTVDAPATRQAVLGSIRAIAATLPHKKHAVKKMNVLICLVGNALEDPDGALHLIPQDARLRDLAATSLPMRDILGIVPSGANAVLLADFGYVYRCDADGKVGSRSDGLGAMTTTVGDTWGDVRTFCQPPGGGRFMFTVLGHLASSSSGVSTADLEVCGRRRCAAHSATPLPLPPPPPPGKHGCTHNPVEPKWPARIAGAGARADLWTDLSHCESAEHRHDGQKAMTAVGQARPEPNADNAT